jgi:hypothetical protein
MGDIQRTGATYSDLRSPGFPARLRVITLGCSHAIDLNTDSQSKVLNGNHFTTKASSEVGLNAVGSQETGGLWWNGETRSVEGSADKMKRPHTERRKANQAANIFVCLGGEGE